jgi:hypothetical protein
MNEKAISCNLITNMTKNHQKVKMSNFGCHIVISQGVY